jgi:hypothetical protein
MRLAIHTCHRRLRCPFQPVDPDPDHSTQLGGKFKIIEPLFRFEDRAASALS